MNYQKTCKQHILDRIDDFVGYELEVSELGMRLTEGENANGSYYCNTYKAEQDLNSFGRSAVADFMEEYKSEFGELPYDAYTEPESFHCLMMIVGVEKMVNKLDWVQDNWDESIEEFTQEQADIIKEQVKALNE